MERDIDSSKRGKLSNGAQLHAAWLDIIPTRPNFFLQSSRITVKLLSYESKRTDKRGQYDRRAPKNLDGYSKFKSIFL